MPQFEDFTIYYAKSIGQNAAADADLKITNTDGVSLIYCIPLEFSKRMTDTSNALALDKTEPDTGTARALVELQITQDRKTDPTTSVLKLLLEMMFIKSSDDIFRKGRFGLLAQDNLELAAEPIKNGGYKFLGFKQMPNGDDPAIQTFTIQLGFVGDHTILGAFV